jgi:hypothetical protein
MKNLSLKEKSKIQGEYTVFSLASWVERTSKVMQDIRRAARTNNKELITSLQTAGVIQEVKFAQNLIPTTGRNVLARLLTGDVTYTGEVDWGALGSGSTAFTNASTQLNTEVFRSQADSQAFDDNIAYIDWFIAAADVGDQTFEEFGAFIDGTGSADSGQAWSLLITGGWIKSGSMFISAKYTLV